MTERFVIAGTGSPEILRLAEDFCAHNPKYQFVGFIDDNTSNLSRNLYGYPFLGSFDYIVGKPLYVVNSIGRTSSLRATSTQRLEILGAKFMNLIHPTVSVDSIETGNGNIIDRYSILHRGSRIGSHNLLLTGVIIGHDSTIGDMNFFGHRCTLNGHVHVGSQNYFGGHSITAPEVRIGSSCTIGMSCLISNNLEDGSRVIARPFVKL